MTDTKGTPRTDELYLNIQQNDDHDFVFNAMHDHAKELERALATAQAELAECRRDAERLDWWQHFIVEAERDLGVKCGIYVTENGNVQIGELERWWSTDIRSAIDGRREKG